MKLKRLLTGLIGFPLVVALLILANNYIIDIVFSIVAILAMREYFNAFGKNGRPVRWIGYLSRAINSIHTSSATRMVLPYIRVICSRNYISNVYSGCNY